MLQKSLLTSRSNRGRRLEATTPDSTQLQGLFFSAYHAYIDARNSTTASSTHSLPCFTELSVLPRLHNSVMYDVVHHGTVLINRCQHDPLCLSPFVLLIPFAALFPTHIPDIIFIVCRHDFQAIKNLCQASQTPLLVQPCRKYPFSLGNSYDYRISIVRICSRVPCSLLPLLCLF